MNSKWIRHFAAVMAVATVSAATAWADVNIVTTTEDLAALAREVGGDRVQVEAIARGYQDPHYRVSRPALCRAEAELHLEALSRRSLGARRTRTRAGLVAAARSAEPQCQDPTWRARLSRRLSECGHP